MDHPNAPIEAGMVILVVGAFVKILPPLAAAFAVFWYGIQIWQSETGRGWRRRWRRLFSPRSLTADDCVAFVLLGVGVVGVALVCFGLGKWTSQ